MVDATRVTRVIGVLGGSFDPVHVAHVAMAQAFATALDLDEVRFLPASQPWQKDALQATNAQRLAMLHAALASLRDEPTRYVVDARELDRPGKTYTIDTLRTMRADVGPSVSLVFLIGADQLQHLDTWKDWTSLWDWAHLAAISRPGASLSNVPDVVAATWSARGASAEEIRAEPSGRSFLVAGLDLDVSATGIRAALARHDDAAVERLVAPGVLDYIRRHDLYEH